MIELKPSRSRAALAAAGLLLCLAGLLGARPAIARPFTDAAGRVVEVPERVGRVLAAGPPASVLLYTLAPEKMAGWVSAPSAEAKPFLAPGTRDLPVYGRLTGRGGTANVEAVLTAKPDLIVDVGSTGATYASLADRVQSQTGIPYVLLDGAFDKIAETYRRLGALIGEEARGDTLAARSDRIVADVAGRIAGVPQDRRPRVYSARGPRGLETGAGSSINTEILDAAGARNVAAQAAAGGLATVSPEQVLDWNPDVIVAADAGLRDRILAEPVWSGVSAVRASRVYRAPTLPFGWFDAPPGVNRLIGLRWLAGLLYPDLFPNGLEDEARDFYRTFYHVELTSEQVAALLAGTGAGEP